MSLSDQMLAQIRNTINERNHLRAEADRLREELADAPKCEACEAMLDCDECLRADKSHKERRRLSAENAKLRELAENLLMAFMVLETPKEQQKCIDRAIELRHELNVLPMETFDMRELGVEVDK